MKVKVLNCILDTPASPLMLQLSVGNTQYKTTWSTMENGQWNESFEFLPNFHHELFSHLQVDVYTRILFMDKWIGRVEIKLMQLAGLELKSFFEVTLNSTRTPINPSNGCGVLSMLIDYTTSDAFHCINELLHPTDPIDSSQLDLQTIHSTTYKKKTVVLNTEEIEAVVENVNEASYTNWLITDESRQAIINIKDMVFAFQKGWDYLNPLQWLTGYLILEKYYKTLEISTILNLRPCGDINHYLRIKQIHDYAFSAYGWQGINFFQKGEGILKAGIINGANEKAIRTYLTHLQEDEYISYSLGDSFIPAHLIVYDKSDNAIILSIRGTMSLTDSLIDFTCEYDLFLDGFAHKGIVQAARAIKDLLLTDLKHHMTLHSANKLILVGHSLGGAIASIMTILLLQEGFENVSAYTFGCPPITSLDIANRYKTSINSYIYQYDLIPRLSYGTVSDMVTICATVMSNTNIMTLFNTKDLTNEFETINKCRDRLKKQYPQFYHPKLYIPGQLYYLDEKQLYYCNREISEEILFCTPQIYKDHLPSAYEKAFSRLCELHK